MVDAGADCPIPRDDAMVCFGAVIVKPGNFHPRVSSSGLQPAGHCQQLQLVDAGSDPHDLSFSCAVGFSRAG